MHNKISTTYRLRPMTLTEVKNSLQPLGGLGDKDTTIFQADREKKEHL
jgi:hypothetical protein